MSPVNSVIVFEVTIDVRYDLRDAFERYLNERHIPDLMATGCFIRASLLRSPSGRIRARYEAPHRAALDRYLNEHAARLRAHVLENFPEGLKFEREEWELLAIFDLTGRRPQK